MSRTSRCTAIIAGLLLFAAPACGGGNDNPAVSGSSATTTTKASTTTTAASAPAVATDKVDIKDFTFTPGAIKVKVGATVTWTNKDSSAHAVQAKDKSYQSADLAQGATFAHTYAAPGTYGYICSIHNSMTGSVVVE